MPKTAACCRGDSSAASASSCDQPDEGKPCVLGERRLQFLLFDRSKGLQVPLKLSDVSKNMVLYFRAWQGWCILANGASRLRSPKRISVFLKAWAFAFDASDVSIRVYTSWQRRLIYEHEHQ